MLLLTGSEKWPIFYNPVCIECKLLQYNFCFLRDYNTRCGWRMWVTARFCMVKVLWILTHTTVRNDFQDIKLKLRRSLIPDSKTWLVKAECKVNLDRTEMTVLRWMCGFTLKERIKSGITEWLQLDQSVWWARTVHSDGLDTLSIKRCMMRLMEWGSWDIHRKPGRIGLRRIWKSFRPVERGYTA